MNRGSLSLKIFSYSPFQSNSSVSGPLMASYRGLAISPNPGVQILQNPAMLQKRWRCFFVFGVLRPNIVCFLYGHNCLFLFVIYPRYLTHCTEIWCAFERLCSPPPQIKDLSGILI